MKKMSRRNRIRLGALGILGLSVLLAYFVYPAGPAISLGSFQRDMDVRLGLDLQGGSALLYQADVSEIPENERQTAIDGARDVIERRVNAFGVGEPVIQTARTGEDWRINVELPGVTDVEEAVQRIGETPQLEFKIEGEPPAYTEEEKAEIRARNEEARRQAEDVLRRATTGEAFEDLAREFSEDTGSKENGGSLGEQVDGAFVEPFNDVVFNKAEVGVVYPEIVETDFGYHIVKVTDRKAAEQQAEQEGEPHTDDRSAPENAGPRATASHILISKEPEEPQQLGITYVDAGLSGEQLERASVVFDPNTGLPIVSITFNEEGRERFAQITREHQGETIAIELDEEIISAPMVNEEIPTGEAVIQGDFTVEEAQQLAQRLNAGALPVPISLVSQQQVGPTLGQESIERSVFAGVLGVIILAIFMIAYYRLPGLIAVFALLIYSMLVLVLFKLWPITLTLAGIAGFILSIGMAVDANILIFERMREELHRGKNLQEAIDDGFQRAWSSIRDSNVSSLITCLVLYWFGSSLIRGFAITLAIGILVSMFSAITISRTLLLFARVENLWWYGVSRQKNRQ